MAEIDIDSILGYECLWKIYEKRRADATLSYEEEEELPALPFSVDVFAVRFGSYRTQPLGQVEFSSEALSLTVPIRKKRGRNGPVENEFTFPFDNVDDCKIHFSSGLCAIFIKPLVAEEYCKQLGLVDNRRGP